MLSGVKRYALETEDWLRYNAVVRDVLSRCKLWTDRIASTEDDQNRARSIVRLCTAARLASSDGAARAVQQRITARVARLEPRRVDWSERVPPIDGSYAPRAVLLEPCLGPRGKGVLSVSFEHEWFKLFRQSDP